MEYPKGRMNPVLYAYPMEITEDKGWILIEACTWSCLSDSTPITYM
ncbi:hypothetical protein ACVLD2_001059 [Paenibacillus sp. PvR052]